MQMHLLCSQTLLGNGQLGILALTVSLAVYNTISTVAFLYPVYPGTSIPLPPRRCSPGNPTWQRTNQICLDPGEQSSPVAVFFVLLLLRKQVVIEALMYHVSKL